jgi:hypothetical protein
LNQLIRAEPLLTIGTVPLDTRYAFQDVLQIKQIALQSGTASLST